MIFQKFKRGGGVMPHGISMGSVRELEVRKPQIPEKSTCKVHSQFFFLSILHI